MRTPRLLYMGLVLLILCIFTGCNGCNNDPRLSQELEGMEYLTPPAFEKDSNIYPIYIRASSVKSPYEKFSLEHLFDNDPKTYWETTPGNTTGEYIEWLWDSLYLSTMELKLSKEIFHAPVLNFNVYIDHVMLGNFTSGAQIPVNRKCAHVRIELAATAGLNSADIPFVNDSLGTTEIRTQKISSIYSSKSAAASELTLYGEGGKKLPFKTLAKVKAFINSNSTEKPKEFFNLDLLFDGNTQTAWQSIADPHTVLFSFAEEQVISEIRFPMQRENETNIQSFSFGLRKRELPVYFLKENNNQGRVVLDKVFKGRNYELTIHSTTNKIYPLISELVFFDGSRPFRIHSDSSEIRERLLLDSLHNTPLEKLVNNRQVFTRETAVYAHSLLDLKKPEITEKAPVETHSKDIVFHIRSNQTIDIAQHHRYTRSGKDRSEAGSSVLVLEGLWRVLRKNSESAEIQIRGDVLRRSSGSDGVVHTEHLGRRTLQCTINKTSISMSELFDGLIIGW
ncbi:MAG: hypothetical protein ACT6QS_13390 [Flavobacteriales bacterium]